MGCIVSVPEDRLYLAETCGAYGTIHRPGLRCIGIPCVHRVAARVSTRVAQLATECETKTRDNVFVTVTVAVQYCVDKSKIYEAVYALADPLAVIKAVIFDAVRSAFPALNLDESYESKDELASAIKAPLLEMAEYGFQIRDVSIVDIDPNAKVKAAMNGIRASVMRRVAVGEQAEAEKVRMVKHAEGECEAKALRGVGLAKQRGAIARSLAESVLALQETVGADAKHATDLVVVTQYLDTLKTLCNNPKSKCILFPDEDNQEMDSIRDTIMQGMAPQYNR